MPDPSVRAVSQAIGSVVAPKPTGTVDGDFIVVIAEVFSSAVPVPPGAGWTSQGTGSDGGSILIAVFTRVAASEPSSWTFTSTDSGNTVLYTYAIQNAPAGVLDGFNIQFNTPASTSSPSGTITTTVNGALLIWGAIGITSFTQPAGMTMDLNGDGGDAVAASVSQATAGSVSKTGSNGSATTVVLLLAVKAGAAPGPTIVNDGPRGDRRPFPFTPGSAPQRM